MYVCKYLTSKHFSEMFHRGGLSRTRAPCQRDPSYIQVRSLGCLPWSKVLRLLIWLQTDVSKYTYALPWMPAMIEHELEVIWMTFARGYPQTHTHTCIRTHIHIVHTGVEGAQVQRHL
jgi:hypothetical protein